MFSTRTRTIVTLAALAEVGLAGWAVGADAVWLLIATAALTAADTLWGIVRRGEPADLAGLEIAATLGLLLLAGTEPTLSLLLGAACLAWLIRPDRSAAAHAVGTA
jgi:hypothetical protein